MNWFLTFLFTFIAYLFITVYGLRSGEQSTAVGAALALVRHPIDFTLAVMGSSLYGVAAFYAIKASPYGITIVISLGLVISFTLSAYWTSNPYTLKHIVGVAVILFGVWLLQ